MTQLVQHRRNERVLSDRRGAEADPSEFPLPGQRSGTRLPGDLEPMRPGARGNEFCVLQRDDLQPVP